MKYRAPAFRIIPVHESGIFAPTIMVNAETYEQAKKEALKRSHLVRTYPDKWRLI